MMCCTAVCREALRAVARQWAVLGNPNAPELLNAAGEDTMRHQHVYVC